MRNGATMERDQKANRRFLARFVEFRFWLAGALSLITGSAAASELKLAFDHFVFNRPTPNLHAASVFTYVVLFGLAVLLLYLLRGSLHYPRTRLRQFEKPPQLGHLILFVSNLKRDAVGDDGFPLGFVPSFNLTEDLQHLVEHKKQGGAPWPWEMILRGMIHHVPRLRAVSVFCSEESILQVHLLGQIIRRYSVFQDLKLSVFVRRERGTDLVDFPTTQFKKGGWEFENFDVLSEALLSLLRSLNNNGTPDNEIMVDFTGGYKVTSVVAVSVTFNRDLKAQYVQTDPRRNHEPIGYDCLLLSSMTPGLP
jgi:hypothetical protein